MELCGHPTKSGPCTMVKNHHAPFHRHRNYKRSVRWSIMSDSKKIIEEGSGRVELGYALTRAAKNYRNTTWIKLEYD